MTLGELPVGTLVADKETKYKGETIIWRIIEHGHDGDPENSTTLLSDKIISFKSFDAKEPKNSNSGIQKNGNSDYKLSNIFQWLNSDNAANEWYHPQHETDQSPSESYVQYNPYDSQGGFLNGFSKQFKDTLLIATKKLINSTDVVGKVHLLSPAEVGERNVQTGTTQYTDYGEEGSTYEFFESNNFTSYATETALQEYPFSGNTWYYPWFFRSKRGYGENLHTVANAVTISYNSSQFIEGIRPVCFIKSTNIVSDKADENGVYFFQYGDIPDDPEKPDSTEETMDGIWRTPKTDWTETDAFNLIDYKRIRNNLLFLRNKMSDIWEEFSIVDMGNDPSDPRYIWKVQYFNAIEENLETINKRMVIVKNYGYKQTFYNNGVFIGFSELNRIESATLQMKQIIEGWEAGLRKLAFRLGAPKGLYL